MPEYTEQTKKRIKEGKSLGGRPNKFTNETCNKICERLMKGQSLIQICRDDDMPTLQTIMNWLNDERKKDFLYQYRHAREIQAEYLFDEMLEICDDASNDWIEIETKSGRKIDVIDNECVNRSKLRVETRKWYLSKVLPKKFGEKQTVEHTGSLTFTALVQDVQ